jgi:transcriptional regulator NrdR family protein
VVDTRKAKRRRECLACLMRWTTTEILAAGTIAPAALKKRRQADPRSWLERINEKLA